MPITPLHFGVLAPINHYHPGKVSNVSFVLANVWMDAHSIIYTLTGYGAISHDDHVFWWALLMTPLIGIFKWTRAWWLGAFVGSTSHILLDMLVHQDMSPFDPFIEGNPFYLGLMQPLSAGLLVLFAWLLAQYVSATGRWMGKSAISLRDWAARLFHQG